MNINSPVSAVLATNFKVVPSDLSIEKAQILFTKKKVKYLAVVQNHEFVGIVCKDAIDKFKHNFLFQSVDEKTIQLRMRRHQIKSIMTTNLVVVSPETTLLEICELYKAILFDAAFVVKHDRLLGYFESKLFEEKGKEKCSRTALTDY